MENILEKVVVPEHPTVNISQPVNVYMPVASTSQEGIASFYEEHFNVHNGQVRFKPEYINKIFLPYNNRAQAWATGTVTLESGDVANVSESDETYNNNAKYYSNTSNDFSALSEAFAKGTKHGVTQPLYSNNNSRYFRYLSEEYATGTKDGISIPGHVNNAMYYAQLAKNAINEVRAVCVPSVTYEPSYTNTQSPGAVYVQPHESTTADGYAVLYPLYNPSHVNNYPIEKSIPLYDNAGKLRSKNDEGNIVNVATITDVSNVNALLNNYKIIADGKFLNRTTYAAQSMNGPLTVLGNFTSNGLKSTSTRVDITKPLYVTSETYFSNIVQHQSASVFNGESTFNSIANFNENVTLLKSLTINGNLTVRGTTTVAKQETLTVKNLFTVVNSEGVTFPLSGFVIKTNSSGSAYAIAYNPTEDSVNIGKGVVNSNGVFTYTKGESQPLATRTGLTNGSIPYWDAVNCTFKPTKFNKDDALVLESDLTELRDEVNTSLNNLNTSIGQSFKSLQGEVEKDVETLSNVVENLSTDLDNYEAELQDNKPYLRTLKVVNATESGVLSFNDNKPMHGDKDYVCEDLVSSLNITKFSTSSLTNEEQLLAAQWNITFTTVDEGSLSLNIGYTVYWVNAKPILTNNTTYTFMFTKHPTKTNCYIARWDAVGA